MFCFLVIESFHKYNTFNSGIAKQQLLKFLSNIRAILLLVFFVLLLEKPTDVIPSHHNLTEDNNKTIGKDSIGMIVVSFRY